MNGMFIVYISLYNTPRTILVPYCSVAWLIFLPDVRATLAVVRRLTTCCCTSVCLACAAWPSAALAWPVLAVPRWLSVWFAVWDWQALSECVCSSPARTPSRRPAWAAAGGRGSGGDGAGPAAQPLPCRSPHTEQSGYAQRTQPSEPSSTGAAARLARRWPDGMGGAG